MSRIPDDKHRKSRAEVEAAELRSNTELLAAMAKSLHSAGLPAQVFALAILVMLWSLDVSIDRQ